MTTTYNWVITSLDCYPSHEGYSDVVFNINWRREADDNNGHTAAVFGSQEVTLDLSANFTPYDQLTQEQVIAWLEATLGTDRIADLDAVLNKHIDNQINPPVVQPALPWAI